LDQGRQFEEKMLEEQERLRNEKTSQDVEMEEQKADNKPQLTGKAARAQMKMDRVEKEDKRLYRPHGEGLDTGLY
jgi:hypothetical protein